MHDYTKERLKQNKIKSTKQTKKHEQKKNTKNKTTKNLACRDTATVAKKTLGQFILFFSHKKAKKSKPKM